MRINELAEFVALKTDHLKDRSNLYVSLKGGCFIAVKLEARELMKDYHDPAFNEVMYIGDIPIKKAVKEFKGRAAIFRHRVERRAYDKKDVHVLIAELM